jgi:hypothetical protein
MVGVAEHGVLIERPKDAVRNWARRGKVQIDDLNAPAIAETVE